MNDDIKFANNLYWQSKEKPSRKLDTILLLVVSFFLIAIIWASLASIDELARGTGKVIPANKIQTIQSLDGGVVSEILVKEGEHINKNQALMKIDTIRFQASFKENNELYLSLLATKTRLQAELKVDLKKRIPKLKFPKELNEVNSDYRNIETRQFVNKVQEYKYSIKVLDSQLIQKKQELLEIRAKRQQLTARLKLIEKKYVTISRLVRGKSKSTYELIQVEESLNTTRGDLKAATLSIPRAKAAIDEAQNKIKEKISNFRTNSSGKLQELEAELKQVESRLVSDNDKLSKTIIRSSVDGVIKQFNINTIGGVVQSGDALIEIVPDSEILLVEAKIDPRDIAFINPTLKVVIKITAYDFSIYGSLVGKIIEISADSIKDEESKDGKTYYKVVIKANKNYLERNGEKLDIIPGMIASVDIVTGKKTIMDFILKPILKTKQNALHER
jgi:adhesin transport system membrane fusion protein